MTITIKPQGKLWGAYVSHRTPLGSLVSRRRQGFLTSDAARSWAEAVKTDLASGDYSEARKDLNALAISATQALWAPKATSKRLAQQVRRIVKALGPATMVDQVSARKLQAYVNSRRASGIAESTLRNEVSRIKTLLEHAQTIGWIRQVPSLPMTAPTPGRHRIPTDLELEALEGHLPEPYRRLVIFLADTGFRCSEALGIPWVSFGAPGYCTVYETKNGTPRTVPLSPRILGILPTLRELNGDLEGPFADLTYRALHVAWSAARAKMGLKSDKDFVPHSLRHRAATKLVQANVALPKVQRFMGHKSITSTQRYVHLGAGDLDGLEELLVPGAVPGGVHGGATVSRQESATKSE